MKMGSYHIRNPMISDPNAEASIPHFSWINLGNFSPATKVDLNAFHARQVDPKPGFAAVPIRSVGPMTEPAKTASKVNKKKPASKSLNRAAPKAMKSKLPRKKAPGSKKTKRQIDPGMKVEKKNLNVVFIEADLDFSRVPPPYCSCTGIARGCYKWGAEGWQSSCCNINLSEYPLPMSPSKHGARVAGRKMSVGAYGKLLCRLAAEGHDLSHPVDLKDHWARHGTNKFVTIR